MDLVLDSDARWSVCHLLGEYGAALDSGRFADWAQLFVADGRLEVLGKPVVGREKLQLFASRSPRGIHIGGMPVMSAGDGVLSSSCPWTFVDLGTGAQLVGYYHDEVVWAEGRHRFRTRRVEMHTPPAGPEKRGSS